MLQAMGYDTGVDLEALLACAAQLPGLIGHDTSGQVVKAGQSEPLLRAAGRFRRNPGTGTGARPRLTRQRTGQL